jgi:hypothetical protein
MMAFPCGHMPSVSVRGVAEEDFRHINICRLRIISGPFHVITGVTGNLPTDTQ